MTMKNIGTVIRTLLAATLLAALLVIAFAWSGIYPVAVGSGHSAPVAWLLETTRDRSVAARAADLTVPEDLDSAERVAAGAGHYDAMCAGCHGKPGQEPADSFEPAPPALYRHPVEPREAFWTVKHGLKMTAMPSHLDHSDRENWDTVAFVRALPDMNAEEYRELTADASHDHGEDGGHEHDSPDAHERTGDDVDHHHEMTAGTPQQAVDGFGHALAEGRRDAALAYLHPKATITEGGTVQSVEEYAAGHLGSDVEFLAGIDIEQLSRNAQAAGSQATVETRSRFRGQVNGQSVDLLSTEYATLIETGEGWRITQIAWSSRPYSPDGPAENETGQDGDAHQHSTGDDDHDH